MTKKQTSLLMYLESRLVECRGRVCTLHMNGCGISQAKKWAKDKFISFGRIADIDDSDYWVTFTEDAWRAAHKERRDRSARMVANRSYLTTEKARND